MAWAPLPGRAVGGRVPRSEKFRRGRPPDSRMKWPKSGVFPIFGNFWGRFATADDSSPHSKIRGEAPVNNLKNVQ